MIISDMKPRSLSYLALLASMMLFLLLGCRSPNSADYFMSRDDGLSKQEQPEEEQPEEEQPGGGEQPDGTQPASPQLAEIKLGTVSGDTHEGGGTATFTIKLGKKPLGKVDVCASSMDQSEGKIISGLPLAFTTSNWNIVQTVIVQGQDDKDVDGDQKYAIEIKICSDKAPAYSNLGIFKRWITNKDYALNSNGSTVHIDSVPGLVWQRSDSGRKYNHADAVTMCRAFGSSAGDGRSWRLPTKDELESLLVEDQTPIAPRINRKAFLNTHSTPDNPYGYELGRYWTDTAAVDPNKDPKVDSAGYYAMGFFDTNSLFASYNKNVKLHVKCVSNKE